MLTTAVTMPGCVPEPTHHLPAQGQGSPRVGALPASHPQGTGEDFEVKPSFKLLH